MPIKQAIFLAMLLYGLATGNLEKSFSEAHRYVFWIGVSIGIAIGILWQAVDWVEGTK